MWDALPSTLRLFSAAYGHLRALLWLLQGIDIPKSTTSAPRVVQNLSRRFFEPLQLMHTRCKTSCKVATLAAARPSMMSTVADTYRAIRWLFVSSRDEHDSSELLPKTFSYRLFALYSFYTPQLGFLNMQCVK